MKLKICPRIVRWNFCVTHKIEVTTRTSIILDMVLRFLSC